MIITAPAIAFIVTSILIYTILSLTAPRESVSSRLERFPTMTPSDPGEQGESVEVAEPLSMHPLGGPRQDVMPLLTRLLENNDFGKNLRLNIIRAGMRLRPSEFLMVCVLCALAGAVIAILLTHQAVMAAILAAAGLSAPWITMRSRQSQRREKLEGQLPDALTLISSSLRSGYSFMRALKVAAEESAAPISEEFQWVLAETALGVPMEMALQRMVERAYSYDLDLVVTSVNIQAHVGGNLSEVLDTIAETIRARTRMKREVVALTAEGKLSGIILILLPIILGVFLDLRNPDYYRPLISSAIGIDLIVGALIAQVIGAIWIFKLAALEV